MPPEALANLEGAWVRSQVGASSALATAARVVRNVLFLRHPAFAEQMSRDAQLPSQRYPAGRDVLYYFARCEAALEAAAAAAAAPAGH